MTESEFNHFEFPYLLHLQFVKNESYEFIKNRKYIQVCKQNADGYTIVTIVIYREDKSIFESEGFQTHISFSLHKEIERIKTNDLPNCIYYEVVFKKQEIQHVMELRALNKIIQNIIGDKYYTWK